MKKYNLAYFYDKVHSRKAPFPFCAQVELTYRCSLDCIHCYCKGSECEEEELTTGEFKRIFDEIHSEGCLWLALTGGEPLIREDFLEIYAYAKEKGFIISIFTNGQLFNSRMIDFLTKAPPHSIEITLNGITEATYEKITQVKGSLPKVMENINALAARKLPVVIKTNLLRQNKDELARIKSWAESVSAPFKYDPLVYPRLNKDTTPCKHRLSYEDMVEAIRQDEDMLQQYQDDLHKTMPDFQRDCGYLYHCDSWLTQFFINPYGRLKVCLFSDKFSVNLREKPFSEAFYKTIPGILNEKFKTRSKCRSCDLRPICYWCPARAYLETGCEEAPVKYYCQSAKAILEEVKKASYEIPAL